MKGFIWPLQGRISGVYGSQRILNGVPKRPHFGVDIAAPTGTLVHAPAAGLVTLTHDDMFFSGGTLIVDHGHGLSSTFIHLSAILVKEGDRGMRQRAVWTQSCPGSRRIEVWRNPGNRGPEVVEIDRG